MSPKTPPENLPTGISPIFTEAMSSVLSLSSPLALSMVVGRARIWRANSSSFSLAATCTSEIVRGDGMGDKEVLVICIVMD